MLADDRRCQQSLHRWGALNQVLFDPSKESHHIVSRRDGDGSTFRLLGVTFDSKLTMDVAVREVAHGATWRTAAVLRARRFLSVEDLVATFKGQVLGYIECRTAAIYHASDSVLRPLDHVLDKFLAEIGLSDVDALLYLNLAPLSARRDMAMLGLIHRAVVGQGPCQFNAFFEAAGDGHQRRTRAAGRLHARQIRDPRGPTFSEQVRRSGHGLVAVCNLLPEEIVRASSVSEFQRSLQQLLKIAAAAERPFWRQLRWPRSPTRRRPLRGH